MNSKYWLNYVVYYLLQLTWGFVQNVIGLIAFTALTIINPSRKRFLYHGAIVSTWKFKSSMGIGMFIFFGHESSKNRDKILVHEYGHTLQSIVLGPLFLFVIGIPSLTWAFLPVFVKLRKTRNVKYVSFYPESWANKWGEKVTKKEAPAY